MRCNAEHAFIVFGKVKSMHRQKQHRIILYLPSSWNEGRSEVHSEQKPMVLLVWEDAESMMDLALLP